MLNKVSMEKTGADPGFLEEELTPTKGSSLSTFYSVFLKAPDETGIHVLSPRSGFKRNT